jgi:hypothetical protein
MVTPGTPPFEVSGDVAGLFPGDTAALPATVHNLYPFPISVTIVGVDVGDAGPGCPGSLLQIGLGPTVTIAVGATATVPLTVTMSRAASDACQGTVFPLTYRASATADDGTPVTAAPPSPPPVGQVPATGTDSGVVLLAAVALTAAGVVVRRLVRPVLR